MRQRSTSETSPIGPAGSISRVTVLWNSAIPPAEVALKELRAAAATLKVELLSVEVHDELELEAAFVGMARERSDGLLVFHDPLMGDVREAMLAASSRVQSPPTFRSKSPTGFTS